MTQTSFAKTAQLSAIEFNEVCCFRVFLANEVCVTFTLSSTRTEVAKRPNSEWHCSKCVLPSSCPMGQVRLA
ncbi:MAG TPA: hypothetical protein VM821_05040 [Abditibacteriaceae bacterium]|nr:hypothetical protein [Abditibacteriaceae bacterium]